MTTPEDGGRQGALAGTGLGNMQGTIGPTVADGVGSSAVSPPHRLTPPSSPQSDNSLPRLPGKGFDSAYRNIQSLKLDQGGPPQSSTPTSHALYSPLSSHPTSPTRTSHTSQSSIKLFHSPRVRQIPSTKSPSPLSSPHNAHFPGNEPPSPSSSKSRIVDSPSIPEEEAIAETIATPTLQVTSLGETPRPMTATGRIRGSTASGPLPNHRILRTATSIPDFGPNRVGQRKNPSATYKPNRGAASRESNQSVLRREPLIYNESVRNSFRSGITVASSSYLDASGTERSSLLSKSDTASEFAFNFSPNFGPDPARASMSVEDAIDMYEQGFYDDPPEELPVVNEAHESGEFRDEGYVSQATIARSPSGQESSTTASQLERSASEKEDDEVLGQSITRTLSLPRSQHTMSSTQIMAGRASATGSLASNLSPPAPRDRYGFKKISQNVREIEYDVWNFHYIDYLERRKKKWVTMLKQADLPSDNPIVFPLPSDKVKRFVRKGIPPEWRGAAWFFYAGGPDKLAKNPGLYARLVEQSEQELSSLDRADIERDLHRTFPDNVRFKPETGSERGSMSADFETPMIQALRRVLQAFAIHNPNIGYCQSLNFLAGLLLLFLDEDEEKAFILLTIITTEYLPGTHGKVLEANVDVAVLMGCIKESLPQVWATIDDSNDPSTASLHVTTAANQIPTVSLATTSWFMSLFVSSLPIETVLRVWDCLFYEGSKTIFRIALAIFKIGEGSICAIRDRGEIFQMVQTLPRKLINPNALMEACFKKRNGFGHLSQETIDARRSERRRLHAADVAKIKGGADEEESVKNSFETVERKPTSALRRAASRSRFKRSLSRKRPITPNPTI